MQHGDRLEAERGGRFLAAGCARFFVPEDFGDEHRLLHKVAGEFVEREVLPSSDAIESGDFARTRSLLLGLGELGLLGFEYPVAYGGHDLGKVHASLVTEQLARQPSFGVSHGVHTGIGSYPLLYLGDETQRERYLPRMATGETVSALACTEPDAGSDIFNIRTRATRAGDGYRLHGAKMWISNSGFADVFMTLAKIDGEKSTFFAVPRGIDGFTMGPEEEKMGIRGSSTRMLHFDGARLGEDDRLGAPGSGDAAFFGILSHARLKLAAGCLGLAKEALVQACSYAAQRRQFGKTLDAFPAVRARLANMALRTWVTESAVYRVAGAVDGFAQASRSRHRHRAWAAQEHALECALIKVLASEQAGRVIDDCMQIFGGIGYSARFPIERFYRDVRIFRIFEGANDLLRLFAVSWIGMSLHRRGLTAMCGNANAPGTVESQPPAELSELGARLAAAKDVFFLLLERVAGSTPMWAMEAQDASIPLADVALEVFALDTAVGRCLRRAARGEDVVLASSLTRMLFEDAGLRIQASARELDPRIDPASRRRLQEGLHALLSVSADGVLAARDQVAKCVQAQVGRIFEI